MRHEKWQKFTVRKEEFTFQNRRPVFLDKLLTVKCRIPKGIGKLLIILDSSVGSAHFEMYWPSAHILAYPLLSRFIYFNSSYFLLVQYFYLSLFISISIHIFSCIIFFFSFPPPPPFLARLYKVQVELLYSSV